MAAPFRSQVRAIAVVTAVLLAVAPQRLDLDEGREVAPGITLYHLTDPSLLTPAAPVSVWILRLDPSRTRLRSALGNDEIMGRETVESVAERHRAAAAINAGFFLPNGDPAGVLKLDGRLVSDTSRPRGAVGIMVDSGRLRLAFARLRAKASLVVGAGTSRPTTVEIDGIDTTRRRGRVMLFTPAYHADTDTADGGLEWTAQGSPLRVSAGPRRGGRTPIPRDGFVLSYGGTINVPPALRRLKRDTPVALDVAYEAIEGPIDDWVHARDIVGGAGLLVRDGTRVESWQIEELARDFVENRHPRTLIGTSKDGTVWLVVVDGRQPELSAGMTLEELTDFTRHLELTNALNLDGGGSTTMWVKGDVVNSPSDATGARPVSDALLVHVVSADPGASRP